MPRPSSNPNASIGRMCWEWEFFPNILPMTVVKPSALPTRSQVTRACDMYHWRINSE